MVFACGPCILILNQIFETSLRATRKQATSENERWHEQTQSVELDTDGCGRRPGAAESEAFAVAKRIIAARETEIFKLARNSFCG